MKIRLSDKDYLLAVGILVAVIIMLTTLVYSDKLNPETKNALPPAHKKTGLNVSPSVIVKKLVGHLDYKSLLNTHR